MIPIKILSDNLYISKVPIYPYRLFHSDSEVK